MVFNSSFPDFNGIMKLGLGDQWFPLGLFNFVDFGWYHLVKSKNITSLVCNFWTMQLLSVIATEE